MEDAKRRMGGNETKRVAKRMRSPVLVVNPCSLVDFETMGVEVFTVADVNVHHPRIPACVCRKNIQDDGALQRHQAKCKLYLAHARTLSTAYRPRKRRHCASYIPGLDIEPLPPSHDIPSGVYDALDSAQDPEARPVRSKRGVLPGRYVDFVAEATLPLNTDHELDGCSNMSDHDDPSQSIVGPRVTRTAPNLFGLVREYVGDLPLRDPEGNVTIEMLASRVRDSPQELTNMPTPPVVAPNPFAPFPNKAVFDINKWYWLQPNKSQADFDSLIQILSADGFDANDLSGINWNKIDRESGSSNSKSFDNSAGWSTRSAVIEVPSGKKNTPSAQFTVDRIFIKSLVEVIRAKFMSHTSIGFHYVPYKLIWAPNADREQEVSGELYNSPAFLAAHAKLQATPPSRGVCYQGTLLRSCFGLMQHILPTSVLHRSGHSISNMETSQSMIVLGRLSMHLITLPISNMYEAAFREPSNY
ncbi:O-antigen polymerase family protein [Salix suchowensis]|nr:O-antigen polymerase family protein [Salix suchowensis]